MASTAAILTSLLLGAPVQAASLTWNTTDGAWDLSANNWNTGGGSTTWSQTNTSTPLDDAYFGGLGGVITIGGTQMAAKYLTFATTGYTLTGGTAYLGTSATSGTSSVAAGVTATINSMIATGNDQTVTIKTDGVLNLGGGFGTSNVRLDLIGSGTLNITGGSSSNLGVYTNLKVGTVNQSGGLFAINTSYGAWLNYSAGRSTTYTITGGTLALNNAGSNTYLSVGRGTGANTASLVVKENGRVEIGTTGYGRLILSQAVDTTSLLDIQGGTFTVGSAQATNKLIFFSDGANSGETATYQQSGGTATVNGFQFGNNAASTYNAGASARLFLTGGNLYVGGLGIAKASGNAATLPANIALGGGTLGASADWSSSLNMNLSGSNGDVTIQAADADGVAKNITLSGTLSGVGGFEKTGGGNLTLSAANPYEGSTKVTAGTLVVSGSLTATSSVSVSSGAELNVNGAINSAAAVSLAGKLSGSGILGAVTTDSTAVIAPGNSPGTLSMLSLTGTTGATLSMELGKATAGVAPVAGADYDQVSTGSVLLNGMTLSLAATAGNNVEIGDKFFLVINTGAEAVGGTFDGLAQGSTFVFNDMTYQISYTANWNGDYASSGMSGGNDVALLAIPEPSTWAFFLGGLGLLLQFQRTRRQRVR